MAILVLFTGQGYNKDMYETLRKEVGWERTPATGGIFHSMAIDKSGNTIRVADIWESEQDLNNFVSSRLMPVMQKHKMPEPKVEIFPVHNINISPAIDKYKLK